MDHHLDQNLDHPDPASDRVLRSEPLWPPEQAQAALAEARQDILAGNWMERRGKDGRIGYDRKGMPPADRWWVTSTFESLEADQDLRPHGDHKCRMCKCDLSGHERREQYVRAREHSVPGYEARERLPLCRACTTEWLAGWMMRPLVGPGSDPTPEPKQDDDTPERR